MKIKLGTDEFVGKNILLAFFLISSLVSCANFGRKNSFQKDSGIINARSTEFLLCTSQPELLGGKSFDLEILIESTGTVSQARVKNNPLDAKFAECVQNKALQWTFLPDEQGTVNTKISFSNSQVIPYSTTEIENTIYNHWSDVVACTKKYGTKAQGEITLQWKITSRGIPAETFMIKRTFLNLRLENCLIDELEEWTFSPHPSGADSIVKYTFQFPLQKK